MNKYYIGNIGFKSKKQCEDYTRTIINNLGCCIINREHPQFYFFNNLILNHPSYDEKISVGIDYFYIQPNPLVKKYYQTMIKRLDGTEIDFSWVYCCKFKSKTTTEELLKAMRNSVKYDVIRFKQSQKKLICNYCNSENELYEDYHVDHHNPSFQLLKDNFLRLIEKQIPTSFTSDLKYKLTIFKEEDEEFKNEWIEYHNINCNFQILCRNCNLRKEKN